MNQTLKQHAGSQIHKKTLEEKAAEYGLLNESTEEADGHDDTIENGLLETSSPPYAMDLSRVYMNHSVSPSLCVEGPASTRKQSQRKSYNLYQQTGDSLTLPSRGRQVDSHIPLQKVAPAPKRKYKRPSTVPAGSQASRTSSPTKRKYTRKSGQPEAVDEPSRSSQKSSTPTNKKRKYTQRSSQSESTAAYSQSSSTPTESPKRKYSRRSGQTLSSTRGEKSSKARKPSSLAKNSRIKRSSQPILTSAPLSSPVADVNSVPHRARARGKSGNTEIGEGDSFASENYIMKLKVQFMKSTIAANEAKMEFFDRMNNTFGLLFKTLSNGNDATAQELSSIRNLVEQIFELDQEQDNSRRGKRRGN